MTGNRAPKEGYIITTNPNEGQTSCDPRKADFLGVIFALPQDTDDASFWRLEWRV